MSFREGSLLFSPGLAYMWLQTHSNVVGSQLPTGNKGWALNAINKVLNWPPGRKALPALNLIIGSKEGNRFSILSLPTLTSQSTTVPSSLVLDSPSQKLFHHTRVIKFF